MALKKVRLANELYANMVEIALWCDEADIAWAIESPKNSHAWETSSFIKLRKAKWDDNLLKNPYQR